MKNRAPNANGALGRLWVLVLLLSMLAGCGTLDLTAVPTKPLTRSSTEAAEPSTTATRTATPHAPPATPTSTPYPVTGELRFELVAQRGGSIRGVAVADDTAYVGLGPRLAALDVSDPAAPHLIAQSEVLPGRVAALLVRVGGTPPGIAYVGVGKYAVMLNVSNPGSLDVLGKTELPGAITHAVLKDHVLYVGGAIYEGDFTYSGFVGTVDVGRPDRLEVLGWVGTPERISGLALSDNALFVGQHGAERGIYTLDVADPTRLGRPVPVSTTVDPYSLRVIGQRLYIGGFMQMHAFDITDPGNPQLVWNLERTKAHPLGMVDGFAVHRGRIYAAGLQPAGDIIPFREVVEPPEPITGKAGALVSSITTLAGDHLFVTGEAGALEIYDISDSESLTPLSVYEPALRSVGAFTVSGDVVYLVDQSDRTARLRTLQLPDLSPLGQFTTGLPEERPDWISGLTVADDRAYLTTRDGLWVFNVQDPAAPSLLGKPEIRGYFDPGSAAPVVVDGIVYLAVSPADLLLAVDLTDVDNPQPVASLERLAGNTIRHMAAGDGLLYAITEDEDANWLHIVDLSGGEISGGVPPTRHSLRFPRGIQGLAARGELAVMAGTEGLTVVSAANPEQPQVLAEVPLSGDGYDVAVAGDLAFVTAGSRFSTAQLLAFDISDPADPRPVGIFDLAGPGSIALTGEYIVVGDGAMGMVVVARPGILAREFAHSGGNHP